jgi:hypothetical protein
MGHETGHAFIDQNCFFDTRVFLQELLSDLKNTKDPEFQTDEKCHNFVEELLADIFDYFIVYGGNFDLYLKTTWRNLDQDLLSSFDSDSISLHLIRTICVLFIDLNNRNAIKSFEHLDSRITRYGIIESLMTDKELENLVKRDKSTLATEKSFQISIEECRENIIESLLSEPCIYHRRVEIGRTDIEKMCKLASIVDHHREPLVLLVQGFIENDKEKKRSYNFDEGGWGEKIRGYKAALEDNQYIELEQDQPIAISQLMLAIHELQKAQRCGGQRGASLKKTSMNLAAILSLWDYYRKEFVATLQAQNGNDAPCN